MHKIILSFLGSIILAGCGSQKEITPAPETPNSPQITSLELYMSRSNLIGPTEFEHYKIKGDVLYLECGKVVRNLPTKEQSQFSRLDKSELTDILQVVSQALDVDPAKRKSLPAPGTNKHLADPGEFNLRVVTADSSEEIITGLDPISQPSGKLAGKLQDLSKSLRSTAKEHGALLCGNRNFYGL